MSNGLNNPEDWAVLQRALQRLAEGFAGLPEFAAQRPELEAVLLETAARMQDNYPYFHPLYAGQMLKPPHPVARLAYAIAMTVNPNNHALDGGKASSAMEKEATAQLAAIFGWTSFLGHLCGGGTVANLEALWIARELAPGRGIAASTQAHYTHSRLSGVLGVPFTPIPADRYGRMDCDALENRLREGGIGTVVAAMGTTALGAVDPLPRLLDLRERYGFRLHADAAYGGYFRLASNLSDEATGTFARLNEVDSIVIDPHKHGLQPYGCGCVLFRDPSVGRFYRHNSPYTYFTSDELHLGEISLECSRAGASAVALWATQRLLPLIPGGEFAQGLEHCRTAALELYRRLSADPRFVAPLKPELDIVVWAMAAGTVSEASAQARRVFEQAARLDLHLALAELPLTMFPDSPFVADRETVLCLRSVLMKPDHSEWIEPIWERLGMAVTLAVSEN